MIKSLQPPYIDTEAKQLELSELLMFVRDHSEFYKLLYKDIPHNSVQLADYPILPLDKYWRENNINHNTVLTDHSAAGFTFKTNSKYKQYSVYTNLEWDALTNALGKGLRWGGIQNNERVGNLFYYSGHHSTFFMINRSLEHTKMVMCFPISTTHIEEIIETWQQFKLTTLIGQINSILEILDHTSPEIIAELSLNHFLYGEEKVSSQQINALLKYFPNCKIRALAIADVEYGELGWVTPNDDNGIYHCFDQTTILEIIDDKSQPIENVGEVGQLLLTNLNRKVMPIIRYPIGERGFWIDPPDIPWRRFKILGKNQEGAQIGPMTLLIDDIIDWVAKANKSEAKPSISNFQLQISHFDQKDCCTLRLSTENKIDDQSVKAHLVDILYQEQQHLFDLIEQQIIHPLKIEWVSERELYTNPITGKPKRIIDQRF